jgi:hypothetical protein
MQDKEKEVAHLKEMVSLPEPPARAFKPVPQSPKNPNGNKKLPMACSYCDFKKECYPNLRKFIYSDKPLFLTEVVKKPMVAEDLEYSLGLQQE